MFSELDESNIAFDFVENLSKRKYSSSELDSIQKTINNHIREKKVKTDEIYISKKLEFDKKITEQKQFCYSKTKLRKIIIMKIPVIIEDLCNLISDYAYEMIFLPEYISDNSIIYGVYSNHHIIQLERNKIIISECNTNKIIYELCVKIDNYDEFSYDDNKIVIYTKYESYFNPIQLYICDLVKYDIIDYNNFLKDIYNKGDSFDDVLIMVKLYKNKLYIFYTVAKIVKNIEKKDDTQYNLSYFIRIINIPDQKYEEIKLDIDVTIYDYCYNSHRADIKNDKLYYVIQYDTEWIQIDVISIKDWKTISTSDIFLDELKNINIEINSYFSRFSWWAHTHKEDNKINAQLQFPSLNQWMYITNFDKIHLRAMFHGVPLILKFDCLTGNFITYYPITNYDSTFCLNFSKNIDGNNFNCSSFIFRTSDFREYKIIRMSKYVV